MMAGLSESDLFDLVDELHEVRAKWHHLGLALRVPVGTLDSIRTQCRDPTDALREAVTWWLRNSRSRSWRRITAALRSRLVGESRLGDDLERRKCYPTPLNPALCCVQVPSHDVLATRARIQQLHTTLEELVNRTLRTLKEKDISLEDIRNTITLTPALTHDENCKMFLRENMSSIYHAATLDELMGWLNLYWDYLNFGLLQRLVEKYGDKETKGKIQVFASEVEAFRRETPLSVFCEASEHTVTLHTIPPGLKELRISIRDKFSPNSMLEDVDKFRQELARQYSLHDFALIISRIILGSVIIVFLIPSSVVKVMQKPDSKFFQEHLILEFTVDDNPVIQAQSAESISIHASVRECQAMAPRSLGIHVCIECFRDDPTRIELISHKCFHKTSHDRAAKVKVVRRGNRLVPARASSPSHGGAAPPPRAQAQPSPIQPMPSVFFRGPFVLCDGRVQYRGERCTYPHSNEERDAWNAQTFAGKHQVNPPFSPPAPTARPPQPTHPRAPTQSSPPKSWSQVVTGSGPRHSTDPPVRSPPAHMHQPHYSPPWQQQQPFTSVHPSQQYSTTAGAHMRPPPPHSQMRSDFPSMHHQVQSTSLHSSLPEQLLSLSLRSHQQQPPTYGGGHDQWPDWSQGLRDVHPWHPEAAAITHPPPLPSYHKRGSPPSYHERGPPLPTSAAKPRAAPRPGSPPELAVSKKPQRSLNRANIQQELTRINYKSKFHSLLDSEETAHSIILEARCNGRYTLQLHQAGLKPPWMKFDAQPFHRRFGYLLGLNGDQIAYATQASEGAFLIAANDVEIRASIMRENFHHTDERLYIAFDREGLVRLERHLKVSRSPCEKKAVEVQFELKHSYFVSLHKSIRYLPEEVIRRLMPDASDFTQAQATNLQVSSLYKRKCSPDQLQALQAIVSCPSSGPPVLIAGPFGTGKTQILATAAHCLFQESARSIRVLVCTQQQVSADSFLRCYFELMLPTHQDLYIIRLTTEYGFRIPELKKYYKTIPHFKRDFDCSSHSGQSRYLIITTCMSSRQLADTVPRGFFTHILIDEGAQMREPEAVAPLCLAGERTKIVIAGDQHQIGPAMLVQGEEPQQNGLAVSLLERLHNRYKELGEIAKGHLATLVTNYRCHSNILKLPEKLFYELPLKCVVPPNSTHPRAPYPLIFVCSSLDSKVQHIESATNESEARIVLDQIIRYGGDWPVHGWGQEDLRQFCVISSTRSQVTAMAALLWKSRLPHKLKDVRRLPTYDIQGREFRAVFISTAEPTWVDGGSRNPTKSICDRYVFNTAITRAQSLVVSVGNPFLLLKMEEHMIWKYGSKGRCWSEYLKLCLDNNTFSIHHSLGASEAEKQTCTQKLRELVEKRLATYPSDPHVPVQLQPPHSPHTPPAEASADIREETSLLTNVPRVQVEEGNSPPENQSESFPPRLEKEFVVKGPLGKGGFGVVYHVKNKIDHRECAVKIITLPSSEDDQTKVLREVQALAQLEHPHIVRYHGSWIEKAPTGWTEMDVWAALRSTESLSPSRRQPSQETTITSTQASAGQHSPPSSTDSDSVVEFRNEKESYWTPPEEPRSKLAPPYISPFLMEPPTCLFIQTELCRKNTLREWLRDPKNLHLRPRKKVMDFFNQILDAVRYIHLKGYVHRDLKPSNIFFSLTDESVIKVGDFGLVAGRDAIALNPPAREGQPSFSSTTGTSFYRSPEQMAGKRYDRKVDIFALGVIFFELNCSFATEMERDKVLRDLTWKYKLPQKFVDNLTRETAVIEWLLNPEPSRRPSAEQLHTSELMMRLRKFRKAIKTTKFERFEVKGLLGKGGFGVVYHVKNKIDHRECAVKIITLPSSEDDQTKALLEVKVLAQLEHPHIVQYHRSWIEKAPTGWTEMVVHHSTSTQSSGYASLSSPLTVTKESSDSGVPGDENYWTPPPEEPRSKLAPPYVSPFLMEPPTCLFIQTELCRKNTLREWLRDPKNLRLRPRKKVMDFFNQILDAVRYIHLKGYVHRDLKPSNIFFSLTDESVIKVGDFGLVAESTANDPQSNWFAVFNPIMREGQQSFSSIAGTSYYRSPEQMAGKRYDEKVDIFALGVIFFELNWPFADTKRDEVLRDLTWKHKLPQKFVDNLTRETAVIEWLLNPEPSRRPSAEQLHTSKLMTRLRMFLNKGKNSPTQTEKQLELYASRLEEKFTVIRSLGEGGQGDVYHVEKKLDRQQYAVKIIELIGTNHEKMRRELEALAKLDHPQIVRYYNSWIEEAPEWFHSEQFTETLEGTEESSTPDSWVEFRKEESSSAQSDEEPHSKLTPQQSRMVPGPVSHTCLFIQTELCKEETLGHWLEKHIENRPRKKVMRFFNQILEAVRYMHKKELIHRNLKPSNIFFSLKKDDVVKIGDFGLVTRIDQDLTPGGLQKRSHGSFAGTPLYMAPEQLEVHNITNKVDVFALGVIFCELNCPFGSRTKMEKQKVLGAAREQQFPKTVDDFPLMAGFIKWMLDPNPDTRPSAEEVYKSPKLTELRKSFKTSEIEHVPVV